MSSHSSLPGSPTPGGPLNPISPARANHIRESSFMSTLRNELRDSPGSVHDKISQFNTLTNTGVTTNNSGSPANHGHSRSHSNTQNTQNTQNNIAAQSKSLERKTADAALKRAMLGREEAEAEMRRYRDESKTFKVQLEKSRDREQRVSERLETVMEQYGRAKETHAHTKAAWEKEIKLARKKCFKNDASIIKLQEEVKAARDGWRSASDQLDEEKARSKAREQEAFEARYRMVGLEEKLAETLERVKVLEQERDAFKTLAKEEEVARIAAEGRIPLPKPQDQDDEFASPRKKRQRVSLSSAEVISSAAGEEEMEELRRQMHWERQRAERAHEMIDFMHAECSLRTCEAARYLKRQNLLSPRRVLVAPREILDPVDLEVLGQAPRASLSALSDRPVSRGSPKTQSVFKKPMVPSIKKSRDGSRRSTIFCPEEGIFRTVSQEEAQALQVTNVIDRSSDEGQSEPPTLVEAEMETDIQIEVEIEAETRRMYARTPSVDPPSFALLAQERISLASLLNAPEGFSRSSPNPNIPTMPDCPAPRKGEIEEVEEDEEENPFPSMPTSPEFASPEPETAAVFQTQTTTTTVPVRDENVRPRSRYERSRTPSGDSHESFDIHNPAMTPTISREEALARIRERRGRARSAAQGGAATSRRLMGGKTAERRDVSAPTSSTTTAGAPRSMSRAAGRVRNVR